MDKELNVARVLKQLVYILEEYDFVLYYDKRFESLKPQIDDERFHAVIDRTIDDLNYILYQGLD